MQVTSLLPVRGMQGGTKRTKVKMSEGHTPSAFSAQAQHQFMVAMTPEQRLLYQEHQVRVRGKVVDFFMQ